MQGNEGIDAQLQSLLTTGADWTQALGLIRKRELSKAEVQTRERMLSLGRCPVCTLVLPCTHYQQQAQLPSSLDTSKDTQRQFNVRYRSANGSTLKTEREFQLSGVTRSQRKRLKLLEKLDLYRQEKINKAINRLEREQQEEEKKRAEASLGEQRRRQRQVQLQSILSTRKPVQSSSPPAPPPKQTRVPKSQIAVRLAKALDQVLPPLSLDVS